MDSHQDIDTENVQAEFNEMKTRLIELAERNQELEQERRALHDTAERVYCFQYCFLIRNRPQNLRKS